jgi:hypothetical protein
MLKKILTAWCKFLSKSDSLYVLNESPWGWKNEAAQRAVGIEQFEHDPTDERWGFASRNDFFTRLVKNGARPLASPEDDKVIVSACESPPYGITSDVKRQDRFWIMSQPYSLQDMLADDDSVDQFVGGTGYQAFLSATNYHRWHSPSACRMSPPHDRLERETRVSRRRGRRARLLPVRRLYLLPRLPPGRDRRLQPRGHPPAARPNAPLVICPLEDRHRQHDRLRRGPASKVHRPDTRPTTTG